MSSNAPGPRPREVTIGGWVAAVASAVLVVVVFDTMANLHSVDMRDRLSRALTGQFWDDLGIGVDDALSFIRGALFVAGAAAAVTGILGVFVLQRHVAARLVLTVAAVPLVLTAPVASGFLGIVVGVATALLWTQPARDWFAGRPTAPRESARSAPAPAPPSRPEPSAHTWAPPSAPDTSRPAGGALPPPTLGWGRPQGTAPVPPAAPPADHPAGQPPAYPAPAYPAPAYPAPAYPAPAYPALRGPAVAPGPVPSQVRVACLLTWIFSGLTAAVYLVVIAAFAVDRQGMIDLVRDNESLGDISLNDSELVGAVIAVSALVILWCLGACLLALLTWRRHAWARIVLLVSIGAAVFVEVLALPYSLVHFAAAATAFLLLLKEPVRTWFQPGTTGSAPGAWPPPQVSGPDSPAQPPATPAEPPSGKPPVW